MNKVKVNNYIGSDPINERKRQADDYVDNLASEILEQLRQEYPDEKDFKIAEISANVCSKFLKAHFYEKSRYGKGPTD